MYLKHIEDVDSFQFGINPPSGIRTGDDAMTILE
jgi:hypothetical protein